MPFSIILGGATIISLVLKYRYINCLKQCFIAILGLIILGFVVNITIYEILVTALMTWTPALALALILQGTRSFVLTIQISSILSIFLLIMFHFFVGEAGLFWSEILINLSDLLVQSGLNEQAAIIKDQGSSFTQQITVLVIAMAWSLYSIILILGCAIYRTSTAGVYDYGKFSDLNFGRFFAIITAISSLLLFVFNVEWLVNLAYLCFLFFWLQGLALLHWFYEEGMLPTIGLILTYVMLPFLNILIIIILAIAGYTDAWFNYRLRIKS